MATGVGRLSYDACAWQMFLAYHTAHCMRVTLRAALLLLFLTIIAHAQAPSVPAPPTTPRRPVTDEYHGIRVVDDYRWLENRDDPEVKQWSAAQNARTHAYLDGLPSRQSIKERLKQLVAGGSASYYYLQFRGGRLFAMKYQPPQQQPMLVALRSADDPTATVIFDPNATSAKGSLSVDFYVPSFDGRYVAAAISENGSEDSSAHVFEVATGKEVFEVVPRVNFATAGGSIEWKADGSGFYYTRYPQGSERPAEDANFYQQVYFHTLGTSPSQDAYVTGKDFPRIAEIRLRASDDGTWMVASVANGDGGEFAHYVMNPAGKWTPVTTFADAVVSVKAGPDKALYLLSRKNAPRGQILRLPLSDPTLAHATVVVPQSPGSRSDAASRVSIQAFEPTPGGLYVNDIMGGPSRLRVFDSKGHALTPPPVAELSAVSQVLPIGSGNVLFRTSTYFEPSAWYRFDAATAHSTRTALVETSPVRFDDAEVVKDFAISKDGTRVPLNIIRRKGTRLDGNNPTLLEGYGGFGVSTTPYFLGSEARVWIDQGGVYVTAGLRGGGEYGEEWHSAGRLTRKQNVFDDFLACAQYLIDHKYTSPSRFAVMGGSNGGLLMGAAFTQRPDLFRAVVSFVGIYDMLRVELDPNGVFNTTEFGTVKDLEQFRALYAYSPYHHVKDGTAYPAILMPTGENDHRVNPMQSRKMTARLQAATSADRPILLRTSAGAGHGIGTALDEQIEQQADVFSFLFDQLGISYVPATR
jgi:prolyl oligopeptidase